MILPKKVNESILHALMHPTLRSHARKVFGVQLYKNNARGYFLEF